MCKVFSVTKIFGKNIKKYRELKGLTSEELSAKTKIDQETLTKLENGEFQNINVAWIYAIAKELNVTTEELNENLGYYFYVNEELF